VDFRREARDNFEEEETQKLSVLEGKTREKSLSPLAALVFEQEDRDWVRKWPHLQQWCVRNEPLQKGIDKA
jgi:hypothetical protein